MTTFNHHEENITVRHRMKTEIQGYHDESVMPCREILVHEEAYDRKKPVKDALDLLGIAIIALMSMSVSFFITFLM